MAMLTVRTPTEDLTLTVAAGTLLADALATTYHGVARPCGGVGRCGKCRVTASGDLSPLADSERTHLTAEELAAGVRLSCCTRIQGDACVWLQGDTLQHRIMTDSHRTVAVTDPLFTRLGAAVDIGTTTLAARLFDPAGEQASAAAPNSQSRYGADVISRIGKALEGGAAEMAACIREDLNRLLDRLCRQAGRSAEELDGLVITGNTAMLYLLTGESVAPLAAAPFAITEAYGRYVSAEALGLRVASDATVYLPRCMAAFVGADITTAQLAADLCRHEETALLADIGTNGELALWHGGRLSVCSTAAGPAFEAANISCGMQGLSGAVDRVWVQGETLGYRTIDEAPPKGICGSGVTDMIATLLESGRLDETGYLEEGDVSLTAEVTFTQEDVRQVQLAKSAIRSGIETLLYRSDIGGEQVSRFAVAGGFGSYVSPDSATAIGLLPPVLRERCYSIGNGALTGAAMILCRQELAEESRRTAADAEAIELAMDPYFSEQYIQQMLF